MNIPCAIRFLARMPRLVLFAAAFVFAAGCELQSSEAKTRAVRRWAPPNPPKIRGVIGDSVRTAIQQRLAKAPPAPVSNDSWKHVRQLYRAHSGAALWLGGRGLDRARTRALIAAFVKSGDDALRFELFPLEAANQALAALRETRTPTAAQLAEADVVLTSLYASLAEDLLTGQIEPRTVSQSWHIDPPEDRIDSVLKLTLDTDRPGDAIERLRPLEPSYDSLRRELARYRELAAKGPWPTMPKGRKLAPGDSDRVDRLTALHERLRAEGLIIGRAGPRGAPADSTLRRAYDSTLAGAVARFQDRHGIVVDSILGPETVTSLNLPVEYRLGQIAANLERFRWLPRTLGSRYILVNVPAFRLQAFDGGEEQLQMKVIVGSEFQNRSTPVFSDSMQYIVFRPYWNVPENIAAEEIFPAAERDPGYFGRNNYEMFTAEGQQRVRQRPGAGNALGLVKFMFPNDFDIYLHDTPDSTLFEKDIRGFSHGCIRLERPQELAQWVLGWPADSVRRLTDEGEKNDRRVNLPRKIPVFIVYLTTYVRAGVLFFGNDLYARDEALVKAVAGGAMPSPEVLRRLDTLRRLAG
jgi:murein L,D-transpeptidase YcbB/YkuD